MTRTENFRERVSEPPDAALMLERNQAGWKLVAVEWQRQVQAKDLSPQPKREEVPYGLRVADDCHTLEEDPEELRVLMLMMERIVLDEPLSWVVRALNDAGYRSRRGDPWDVISVFNMLPRLIEVGPRIFSAEEWEIRRRRLFKIA